MIDLQPFIEDRGPWPLKESDIASLEEATGFSLSDEIREFILRFSDSFLRECYFEQGEVYAVPNYICGNSSQNVNIFKLVEGNLFYGDEGWLPFAIDPGGWVFNYGLKDEVRGQIWLDRFDSGDDDVWQLVAEDLSSFVAGLQLEVE